MYMLAIGVSQLYIVECFRTQFTDYSKPRYNDGLYH